MATHYRTKAFIIKKKDRQDSDQFLTVFTEDFGKLEILGKAIRKIKSKLRGGAELFYLSEIEFIQGKSYKTLTDSILINNFSKIKKDLERLEIAYALAETLDKLVPEEERDENLWQLISEVFEKLNLLKKTKIIYYYFFWNLVSLLGYQPELQGNSLCGKRVNSDVVKILKVILKKDWQILARLKFEPSHQRLFKNISEWYTINIIKAHDYEK